MLLKHSLNREKYKVLWEGPTTLGGHLTGESFVASVAAVCLLLARRREQPEIFNFKFANDK